MLALQVSFEEIIIVGRTKLSILQNSVFVRFYFPIKQVNKSLGILHLTMTDINFGLRIVLYNLGLRSQRY